MVEATAQLGITLASLGLRLLRAGLPVALTVALEAAWLRVLAGETGKVMAVAYLAIYRIRNDRIVEAWAEWDNAAGLRQLGHADGGSVS